MFAVVQCPNPSCNKFSKIRDSSSGHAVRCPFCGQRFTAQPTASGSLPSSVAQRNRSGAKAAAPSADPESPVASGEASQAASQTSGRELPQQIGRFLIRARVGAGAFGTVYRAYDPQLDREVALKVPQASTLDSPKAAERFLREAKAAARLRHPHIVPIYDAGCDGDQYYIAAAFIEGQTLAEAIDQRKLTFRQVAEIVHDLAEGLAYAHEQGIVHRDIKPANIMLDVKGKAHLMDFGLAHRQDSTQKITQDGAILGTPAYMAPEQAKGQQGNPPPASDQYSLGVVLYELLCGQTPFSGPPQIVLFNAIHTEPPAPRALKATLPRDLETICLKAMAKEREDRYASCQELADDLRRWWEGEPIRARRLGPLERLVRWGKRNRAVAALVLAVAVLLISGTVVSYIFALQASARREEALAAAKQAEEQKAAAETFALQARTGREEALAAAKQGEEQRSAAEANAKLSRRNLYVARMNLAQVAWREGHLGKLLDMVEECRPEGDEEDLRGFEWRYLWGLCRGTFRRLQGHTGSVTSVAFSPDGRHLASASEDRSIKLWELGSNQDLRTLNGHTEGVCSVAFSPDGLHVASASYDKTVKLWDVATGQELRSLKGHATVVKGVAFSPDGEYLASIGVDRAVKLWDLRMGKEVRTLQRPCVSESADGFVDFDYNVAFERGPGWRHSSVDRHEQQKGRPADPHEPRHAGWSFPL